MESKSRPRSLKQREAAVKAIMRKVEIVDTFVSHPPKRTSKRTPSKRPAPTRRRRKYLTPESLFDLRTAEATRAAVRVVYDDEGNIRPEWRRNGETISAELTLDQRRTFIQYLVAAMGKFGISVTDVVAEKSRRLADVADLTLGVIEDDIHRKAGIAREVERDLERRVKAAVELLADDIALARAQAKADYAAENTKAARLVAVRELEMAPVTADVKANAKAELAEMMKALRDKPQQPQSSRSIESAVGPAPSISNEQLGV